MLRPIAAALALLGSLAVADAAPSCFRDDEIEADQALRLRSEVMVLSDTCRTDAYRHFMARNSSLIGVYQQRMIEHFRRSDGGHAEAVFDRYVTALANEAALGRGGELTQAVCTREGAFLGRAGRLDPESFRHDAAARAAERQGDYRRCKP